MSKHTGHPIFVRWLTVFNVGDVANVDVDADGVDDNDCGSVSAGAVVGAVLGAATGKVVGMTDMRVGTITVGTITVGAAVGKALKRKL